MQPVEITPEFVQNEVQKLQYLYRLKREIRYAESRTDDDYTESVAEHVFGMHICARYFLPFENPTGSWNRERIYDLITIHDFDEIETGDVIGYLKTNAMQAREVEAMKQVIANSPQHLQDYFTTLNDEYAAQKSIEAKFVKAIDRFEPSIHIYREPLKKTLHRNQTTSEQSLRIKLPYMTDFPYMTTFTRLLHDRLINEGYFVD
jgi:putative hydrolase of HD superfamily